MFTANPTLTVAILMMIIAVMLALFLRRKAAALERSLAALRRENEEIRDQLSRTSHRLRAAETESREYDRVIQEMVRSF